MTAPLHAGFECGRLPWSGMDLLHETRHTPETDMAAHYASAIAHGATAARDGLSWRHDIAARIAAVPDGFPVTWDMVHFDMPPDPEAHAAAVASALGAGGRCIAVNEPTIHAQFCADGQSWPYVETAMRMMRAAPGLRFACCDPLHDLDPATWWATDRLVESGLVDTVGINYYPHHARVPLAAIIREARTRYPGLAIAVTETGWHEGHENNRFFPHIPDRRAWLAHVQREIVGAGGVQSVCWYPWLDMPCWDGSGDLWPCGWPEAA